MQKFEKRAVPRTTLNGAARLQSLGASAGTNGAVNEVQVVDASVRGMRLRSKVAMNAGQAVKIELGEAMFLGEICYCAAIPDAAEPGFHLGVITKECLSGLASLHQLIRALSPETAKEMERAR